jgi:pyruvate formate lyase activating enzyme
VEACLYGAREIVGREAGLDELMEEILADRIFYKNSGGGVTISGGEPLLQHGFVAELLKESKQQGLHTALETCGHGSAKILGALIPHLDLALFDIKQLNPLKHIKYTGLGNKQILKNLRMLSREVECWLRVPLIQDVNDSIDHMDALSDLALGLNIKKMSLLPYHEGGVGKALQIGMEYAIPDARKPENGHIRHLAAIAREKGINVSIGH